MDRQKGSAKGKCKREVRNGSAKQKWMEGREVKWMDGREVDGRKGSEWTEGKCKREVQKGSAKRKCETEVRNGSAKDKWMARREVRKGYRWPKGGREADGRWEIGG